MRSILTSTLDQAARDYAGQFLAPTVWAKSDPKVAASGRDWVLQSLYNMHFKDEFEHVRDGIKRWLGVDAVKDFDGAIGGFEPRSDDVFEEQLAKRLGIKPDGTLTGELGSVVIGQRVVGSRVKAVTLPSGREITVLKAIKEPVFAGDQDYMASVNAASLTMSAETALLMLDAMVDNLDEGTGAAVISGYSGTRPADPDAAITGTLLFRNAMSDPAFAAAVDDTDGTVSATASSISDDTSADATGTASHFRVSATNDGATPLDDHVDGNIGTSGEDLNLNTTAIVSGATVSITSYVMNLSQGTGAS